MSHNHDHDHAAAVPNNNKAFAIGIGMNLAFVFAEVTYGVISNSVALIADGAHNLSDVLGLALAWGATILAKRNPSMSRTYGLRRSTILAALANALLLIAAVGGVIWEAIARIHNPGTVDGYTVIVVAAIGVVINGVSAFFFFRGKEGDANIRGAFLHLAADCAVSIGVVIGGIIILKTGWQIVDPIISIVISVVVLGSTWSLFKESLNLSLDSVPKHIDISSVRALLLGQVGIQEVHDLHVWSLSTTDVALTAHLVTTEKEHSAELLAAIKDALHEKFGISHITVQVETSAFKEQCPQASLNSL